MFNNKYQPYERVPHCDSGDEIELNDRSNTNNTNNTNNNNKITNLLKLTAHRRIRHENTSSNDNIIIIDNESESDTESTHLITKEGVNNNHITNINDDDLDEIDLNNAHGESSDDDDDDDTMYDDHVLLLYLDGKKKKIGIMNNWRIWQLKNKYFKSELEDGKNIRLIYRGKLLQDALFINTYNIPTNGFIHVSISKNGNLFNYKQSNNNNNTDINYENFDDGMDDEAVARALQQREMELSMNNNNNGGNRLFGQYGMDGNDEMDANRARREFFCGMFLGMVAGIWILIFLILAQRGGYSRRFRLGVTLGVAINLMIQLSYQYPNVDDNGNLNANDGTDTSTATTTTDNQSDATINTSDN